MKKRIGEIQESKSDRITRAKASNKWRKIESSVSAGRLTSAFVQFHDRLDGPHLGPSLGSVSPGEIPLGKKISNIPYGLLRDLPLPHLMPIGFNVALAEPSCCQSCAPLPLSPPAHCLLLPSFLIFGRSPFERLAPIPTAVGIHTWGREFSPFETCDRSICQ